MKHFFKGMLCFVAASMMFVTTSCDKENDNDIEGINIQVPTDGMVIVEDNIVEVTVGVLISNDYTVVLGNDGKPLCGVVIKDNPDNLEMRPSYPDDESAELITVETSSSFQNAFSFSARFDASERKAIRAWILVESESGQEYVYSLPKNVLADDLRAAVSEDENIIQNFRILSNNDGLVSFSAQLKCRNVPIQAGICYATTANPTIDDNTEVMLSFENGLLSGFVQTDLVDEVLPDYVNNMIYLKGHLQIPTGGTYYLRCYMRFLNEGVIYSNESITQ